MKEGMPQILTQQAFDNLLKMLEEYRTKSDKATELIEEVSDIYCLEPHGFLCYKLDPEGGEEMCVACKAKDFLNISLDK